MSWFEDEIKRELGSLNAPHHMRAWRAPVNPRKPRLRSQLRGGSWRAALASGLAPAKALGAVALIATGAVVASEIHAPGTANNSRKAPIVAPAGGPSGSSAPGGSKSPRASGGHFVPGPSGSTSTPASSGASTPGPGSSPSSGSGTPTPAPTFGPTPTPTPTPTPAPTNDLANPSFENGSTTGWNGYQGIIASVAFAGAHAGSYVCQVSYKSGGYYTVNSITPDPVTNSVIGQTYTVSAWVRAVSTGGKPIRIALRVQSQGGAYLYTKLSSPVTLTTTFQQITVSYTSTYTGDIIGTYVEQDSASSGDSFYVDDFLMY